MVFLLLSPHNGSVQEQKSTPKLYSSGTRSRNLRSARWHFCLLQRSEPGTLLVHASTYSARRAPHFSNRPQSWAAFKHWFCPSTGNEDTEVERDRVRCEVRCELEHDRVNTVSDWAPDTFSVQFRRTRVPENDGI